MHPALGMRILFHKIVAVHMVRLPIDGPQFHGAAGTSTFLFPSHPVH